MACGICKDVDYQETSREYPVFKSVGFGLEIERVKFVI